MRRRGLRLRFDFRGALNPRRRDIENPRENQRDGKSGENQNNQQALAPVWQLPGRENSRGDLNNETAGNDVSRRHAVNFSPLQFLKEAAHAERLIERGRKASTHSLRQEQDRHVETNHFTPERNCSRRYVTATPRAQARF